MQILLNTRGNRTVMLKIVVLCRYYEMISCIYIVKYRHKFSWVSLVDDPL